MATCRLHQSQQSISRPDAVHREGSGQEYG